MEGLAEFPKENIYLLSPVRKRWSWIFLPADNESDTFDSLRFSFRVFTLRNFFSMKKFAKKQKIVSLLSEREQTILGTVTDVK